jgi:tetratricopeptide (TPR) repeat protein
MGYRNHIFLAALTVLLPAGAWLDGAEPLLDKAEQALASNDYPAAINLFEKAVGTEPDNLRDASEYRQAVIRQAVAAHPPQGLPADFDREIAFFQKLVAEHPASANAYLNYGFTYVDKMAPAGPFARLALADTAVTQFGKAIELKPTWLAYYTRGRSYLYWPKMFGRAALGVADLEKAYAIQKVEPKKSYYARVYISLGDGYWKTDNPEKAKAIWKEGLAQFPENQSLKDRLSKQGDDLEAYIRNVLDPAKRVDTDLRELWSQQ